ncbi:hypothetical protein KBB68_03270 [Candidatus Babeliales bacterium]|nr:hypothetical protein [Candidatus Babeliales bacterium]
MKKSLITLMFVLSPVICLPNDPKKLIEVEKQLSPDAGIGKQLTPEQTMNFHKFKQNFDTWLKIHHPDFAYYHPNLQDIVLRLYMEKRNNDLNMENYPSLFQKYNQNIENWSKYSLDRDLTKEEQDELDKIQLKHEQLTEEFAKNNLNLADPYASIEHMQNANTLIEQTQNKIAKFDYEANSVAFQQREKIGNLNVDDLDAQFKAKNDVMNDVLFGKDDFRNLNPLKDTQYKYKIGKLRNKYEEIFENYHQAIKSEEPKLEEFAETENVG